MVTHGPGGTPAQIGAVHLQLLLSAVYVLGCAYRCLLPVHDIPRLVLVDSPLSSVVVGRSVATVAELCFATQWALLLYALGAPQANPIAQDTSLAIVPLIALAELCSWYAVLTTTQGGHIVENSIWGVAAALVVTGLLTAHWHRLDPTIIGWCLGGAAYVSFIFFSDVPMYWTRWRNEQDSCRPHLGLARGLADAWRRRVVSHRWDDWRSEVLWMTLYFTLGVWSSLSLVYVSMAGAYRG